MRRSWDWPTELPRLTLAAALTACYGAWAYDLVILLLPLLQAVVWLLHSGPLALALAFGAVFAFVCSGRGRTLLQAGPLAPAHAAINEDCARCHT